MSIDRQNAERIATVIVRAIRNSAAAAPDFEQREPRIAVPLRAWASPSGKRGALPR